MNILYLSYVFLTLTLLQPDVQPNCSYYECPVSLVRLTKGTVVIQPSQILHLLHLQRKLRPLFCK